MRIVPIRGTEINGAHAPAGVAVDAPEWQAREMLSFGLASRAPDEPPSQPVPVIETATAPTAAENAAVRKRRK